MTWAIWALGAAAVFALTNLVDKVVIDRRVRQPEVYLLFGGCAAIVPLFVIGAGWGVPWTTVRLGLLSTLTGVLLIAQTFLYFSALKLAGAAVVVALFQMVRLFSALWGYLFFAERFSNSTYLGIGLVTVGAVGVSIEMSGPDLGGFRDSPPPWA